MARAALQYGCLEVFSTATWVNDESDTRGMFFARVLHGYVGERVSGKRLALADGFECYPRLRG